MERHTNVVGKSVHDAISSFTSRHGGNHWWCSTTNDELRELMEQIPPYLEDREVQLFSNIIDRQISECIDCLTAHHAAQVLCILMSAPKEPDFARENLQYNCSNPRNTGACMGEWMSFKKFRAWMTQGLPRFWLELLKSKVCP